jgi:hypothetical protein
MHRVVADEVQGLLPIIGSANLPIHTSAVDQARSAAPSCPPLRRANGRRRSLARGNQRTRATLPLRGRHTDSTRIESGDTAGMCHSDSRHQGYAQQNQGAIGEKSAPQPRVINVAIVGLEVAFEIDLCWRVPLAIDWVKPVPGSAPAHANGSIDFRASGCREHTEHGRAPPRT